MKAPDDLFEPAISEKYLTSIVSKVNAGEKQLELDFSECRAISAYTVARLISIDQQVKSAGGKLTISRVQSSVKETLKLLHLDKVLSIS